MIILFVGLFVLFLQLLGFLFLWALFPNFTRIVFSGFNALLAAICIISLNPAGIAIGLFFGAVAWFIWEIMPLILHGPKWRKLGIYRPVDLWTPKPQPTEGPPKPTPFVASPHKDPFAGKRWSRGEKVVG